MSRQNPFMRGTGDRYCNNCQNGCQNNCNDQQSCCDDDKDKNPCIVCQLGPEGPKGPQGPRGPIGLSVVSARHPSISARSAHIRYSSNSVLPRRDN